MKYSEQYYLYQMQIYYYDKGAVELLYCTSFDFVSAIELTEKYIQDSERDADICGCWELQETLITQIVNERQNNNE